MLDLGSLRHNGLYPVAFLYLITTTIDAIRAPAGIPLAIETLCPLALPGMTLVKWMRSCSTIGTSELPDQAAQQAFASFFVRGIRRVHLRVS